MLKRPWRANPPAILLLVLGALALFSARYPRERLGYEGLRSTRVVDRAGRLLYERRGGRGTYQQPVSLDAVSRWAVLATLAGEDAAFRWHPGVDPIAVARALWLDLRAGRFAYGGSTLTQQLAKNLEPEPRTLAGKLREAWVAWRLERTLTKDEILTQYLNRTDYGRSATGIEAAAQRYFGCSARDLELADAALLAILPRAPSFYDPARHPERALVRRAHVLELMVERGWLSREAADVAAAAPLRLHEPASTLRARHAIDHLLARDGIPQGVAELGLTLDVELQEALERVVQAHLALLRDAGADQAGVVVLDNASGDVLAMVGSRRWDEPAVAGAVNATTALRAPGSTLKPFVYALAFEDGASPSSLIDDEPIHLLGYQPRSIRGHHFGTVALRDALGSSLNVPAVRIAEQVGVERLAQLLHAAGLAQLDPAAPHGLALALGGTSVSLVELTNAYATLARGGTFRPWRLTSAAPRGPSRRVLTPEVAFLVTDALADPRARRLEFGLETPLELPFAVAAKTGTSQAFTDNVAIGYTPDLSVGVWVGNFDGRPLRGMLAMRGAAPLLREALLRAHRGRPDRPFQAPSGVERQRVCAGDDRSPTAPCQRWRHEWVIPPDPPSAPGARPAAERVARRGAPLVITAPPAGARFLLDPLLPAERQRLPLRAAIADGAPRRVRWRVDGRVLEEARGDAAVHWGIARGRHRIRVELADDARTWDEVEIDVEG